MSDFKIRDATLEDVPAINELFNAAVNEDLLDWDLPQAIGFHERWFAKMKGYPLLVAESGEGECIAYGALEPQSTAAGSSLMLNANVSIITSSHYRRRGVATEIWRALCAHQLTYERQIYLVVCKVLSNNEAGNTFAKKLKLNLAGKLDKFAVKSDKFVDQCTFATFLGASPSLQGLACPPADLFKLPPTPENLEIRLDSPGFVIRDATLKDLPFLTQIYNECILSSSALEHWLPKTVEDRRLWLQSLIDQRFPCVIAEQDSEPLGYISLTPWNEHPDKSYLYSANISAYIRKDLKSQRVGEALYTALLKHPYLKEGRIFTVVAVINSENGPAVSGSLKAGFRQAFAIPRAMVKFGQAFGGIWLQREFGPEPDLRQLAIERSRWHDDMSQIEMH